MRILTFLHSFEPGGVERVALRLVRQWREMGISAPLFVGREEGALQAELADGLEFVVPPSRFSTARFETFWMIWTLPRFILRTKPDVIFCAGNTYTVVAAFMKLFLGKRCPPIVVKVSNDLIRPGLPPVAKTLFEAWAWLQGKMLDAWVVMHPAMGKDVRDAVGSGAISVIPDPALTLGQIPLLRQWRCDETNSRERRFVAVGRLVPQKNYTLMIRSFAQGAGDGDGLKIIGDGPQQARLRALVEELNLSNRVGFTGHVEDASSCLLDHDALLLTSRYEGIPAVLVEAMTCGMPIAATDCGPGVRGLLADYANALVAPNDDADAFADCVRSLSFSFPKKAPIPFDAEAYTIEAGARAYIDTFERAVRARAMSRLPSVPGVSEPVPAEAPGFARLRAGD